MNLKNQKLIDVSTAYAQESISLKNKLENYIYQAEKNQSTLLLSNQLLEQNVQERISALKKINDHLTTHQANLAFAHEAAYINSWSWNIQQRSLSISSSTSNKEINLHNQDIDISLIHPDDLSAYKTSMHQHLKGLTQRFEAIYRIKKNNQWYWIQDIGKVITRHPINNKPLKMVGIYRNIQKEKSDQERLKLAASVFKKVEEGIFVLNNDLCFLEVNPYFEKLTGLTQTDVFGKYLLDITTHVPHNKTQINLIKQLILHGEYDGEIQEEFSLGKPLALWLHINAIKDDDHKVIHYVGIITDLTDRKRQEQRLTYLENYDALTDLPNRYYFNLQLHRYFTDQHYSIQKFAIYRINIDRFRAINEFLNHHTGDHLLKKVAQRLRAHCSDALFIAYLNNDDFAVIYNFSNNTQTIQNQAEKIFNIFKQPFNINQQEQMITVSIGIAIYPEHGRQIDILNLHAEFALSEAKKLGGNTINYYANQSLHVINNHISLENDLRKAIKNKEFIVYYQPKICTLSQSIYGFEALIRWHHSELGLISPDIFIPLAEETSLITEIGQFVLFETCKQIRIWQDLGFHHIRVSVNIVAQQIHRGQLIQDIDNALATHQISGQMLELELTESSLLDKSDDIIQLLEDIKARQILISLDDFGTGYSSLAYLTRYPIDTLKIDQAFISKIGQEKEEAIVNAIIAMGKAIGLTLIAEGVETEKQIDFLKSHGCYILQGFYFSKPLTAKQSTNYLTQYQISH